MNRMNKAMLVITLTLFSYLGAGAQQAAEFRKDVFISHSDSLPYRLAAPPGFERGRTYPLVVFLHGSGQRGRDNQAQLANVSLLFDSLKRARYPCFILVPQCPKNDVWVKFPAFPRSIAATDTPTRAAALTLALIEELTQTLPIDKKRIYLTGLSMGGEGCFDLLTRAPRRFAAAVPICAVADTSKARSIRKIPIWAFHGSADQVNDVRYTRMMIDALKKAGGHPRYTEYAGVGHNSWLNAYAEPGLLPWLFSQKRR